MNAVVELLTSAAEFLDRSTALCTQHKKNYIDPSARPYQDNSDIKICTKIELATVYGAQKVESGDHLHEVAINEEGRWICPVPLEVRNHILLSLWCVEVQTLCRAPLGTVDHLRLSSVFQLTRSQVSKLWWSPVSLLEQVSPARLLWKWPFIHFCSNSSQVRDQQLHYIKNSLRVCCFCSVLT